MVSYVVVARGLRGPARVFADKNMTAVPGVFGDANGRGAADVCATKPPATAVGIWSAKILTATERARTTIGTEPRLLIALISRGGRGHDTAG